ncbi:hypothetical protein SmJEL517_g01851 [Synchytrium microbalum]|uniref:Ammonium transporter AmtB-like domain-containing protein n=1 Tax=Synchytrium microbalum TaxID=1806994 RepID=A0A507C923_9FUNG|nr:uncharacterized protein SmJEL517_g01851 [Synchytrium microbalum]TPX35991.1 hypothetical protein SmJEL517_g01851 [Synchytrium microbalum]
MATSQDAALGKIIAKWASPTNRFPTDTGSLGFMTFAPAFTFLVAVGVALFWSGMSRAKNALTMTFACGVAFSIVAIQWVCFGFSLTFSESGNSFIGDFAHAGFANLGSWALVSTAPAIPSITFALYELVFAAVAPTFIFGAIAERFRLPPMMIFIVLYTTLVYDPLAHWLNGSQGWLKTFNGTGVIDFAGSSTVHIAAGMAGLAYALIIGKRKPHPDHANGDYPMMPHHLVQVFLGFTLIFFGWFGFVGGRTHDASARAAEACALVAIAGSAGGLSWSLFDYVFSGQFSSLGYCSGSVAGLVAISAGAGNMSPWAGALTGALAGVLVNMSCSVKNFGHGWVDDALDTWSIHFVGGVVGSLCTGLFADSWVVAMNTPSATLGGAISGRGAQLGYQILKIIVTGAWSFIISYSILYILNKIPGCHLRATDKEEDEGMDASQMGELAYDLMPADLKRLYERELGVDEATAELLLSTGGVSRTLTGGGDSIVDIEMGPLQSNGYSSVPEYTTGATETDTQKTAIPMGGDAITAAEDEKDDNVNLNGLSHGRAVVPLASSSAIPLLTQESDINDEEA